MEIKIRLAWNIKSEFNPTQGLKPRTIVIKPVKMDKVDRIDEKYIDDLDKSDEISKMVKLNRLAN